MIELTRKEQEALIIIYKDFTNFYNANSLSKKLEITQVGAMKILKRLEKAGLLASKQIGKSIIYKIDIDDELAQKLMGFAFVNEAGKHERWRNEFKNLCKKGRIILFYGSASRNYAQAKDIDIMIILKEEEFKEVNAKLEEIQAILPKKIHAIKSTKQDFIRNLRSNNKAILEIIRTGIILCGYDNYMEIMNGFTSF